MESGRCRTGSASMIGGRVADARCRRADFHRRCRRSEGPDEVDVWAWGRGLESWLVEHLVIEGGPGSAASWVGLDALLARTWPHASGATMALSRLAIDTGYEAPAVYAWARRAGFAQVAPVKGVEGFNRASPVFGPTFVDATDGGKRLRRGARLWTVAVSTFKAETYRFLRLDRPTDEATAAGEAMPAGRVLLPSWIDSEWVKQLVAEQLVTVKNRRGFQKLEWQKLRERNEALDCRVYARAAAWIAGADRWHERKWAELEASSASPARRACRTEQRCRNRPRPAPQPIKVAAPTGSVVGNATGSDDDLLDRDRAHRSAPGLCLGHAAGQL